MYTIDDDELRVLQKKSLDLLIYFKKFWTIKNKKLKG